MKLSYAIPANVAVQRITLKHRGKRWGDPDITLFVQEFTTPLVAHDNPLFLEIEGEGVPLADRGEA